MLCELNFPHNAIHTMHVPRKREEGREIEGEREKEGGGGGEGGERVKGTNLCHDP